MSFKSDLKIETETVKKGSFKDFLKDSFSEQKL
jgi:hypothetical protein